ncbi:MAG: DUF4097 domain-containing protein [Ruminococcaceae bacterium]|nr:DUF4097 domain-containing protein [Oscillospiraceae bacterium]
MRNLKKWLIIGASLVLIGCIIFTGVMTMLKWDFKKLSTLNYETNEYTIDNEFKNISVESDTADITLLASDEKSVKVVCHEPSDAKHTVVISSDTLEIKKNDTRKWYEHIGISFESEKITVYLPKGEYGKLSVKASTGDLKVTDEFKFADINVTLSTGDITLQSISANSISLRVSTGKIALQNIKCEGDLKAEVSTGKTYFKRLNCDNIISCGNTGDITMENVIAKQKISVERSTGDVRFDGCDAAEIFVVTDTGDVRGTLLSGKLFITKTDTGSIDVPNSTSGGRCEITTDTGDIKIELK